MQVSGEGACLTPAKSLTGASEGLQLRKKVFSFIFCFLNASSLEAMFLLKPLKELRAKRKGTVHVYERACLLDFYFL